MIATDCTCRGPSQEVTQIVKHSAEVRIDSLKAVFDDSRLVSDAGLIIPATLAERLGLAQLIKEKLDLGTRPGAARPEQKAMTLVYAMLAGALAHFPSGNFSANSAWTQLAAISHNLARFGQVIGSPGADDPSPAGSPALAECLHRGPDQDQGLADSGLTRHLEFDELHLPGG